MRRTQFLLAVIAALLLVASGLAASAVGPRPPAPPPEAGTITGAWFCPHGGGRGWSASLDVANPGTQEVRIRVTDIGSEGASEPTDYSLPPRSVQHLPVSAGERAATSMVEYFGGWVAAGWTTQAGGEESGVAAEPCLAEAGRRLYLPDGTTQSGQQANVVVMNPFGEEAVVSLTLHTQEARTVTTTELTDYALKPRHSVTFALNEVRLADTLAVDVATSRGRVAAASLGIAHAGGIRSSGAVLAPGSRWILPGGLDNDSASVVVMDPSNVEARLTASIYTDEAEQTAAGTNNQVVEANRAATFSGLTSTPSAIDLRSAGPPAGVVAVRRSFGIDGDQGATAGAAAPAVAWVALPTVTGPPYEVRLFLANPGDVDAMVDVTMLGSGGIEAQGEVSVPARRTVEVPTNLTDTAPLGAVLIECTQGVVVPAGVGYSLDHEGYAVAAGVPIPSE